LQPARTPEPRLVYPNKQTNSRGSKALNKCAKNCPKHLQQRLRTECRYSTVKRVVLPRYSASCHLLP